MNQADGNGTPLYIACFFGHTEVVAKLLAANAEVDRTTVNGSTPMSTACHNGHLRCVQLLSSYGARHPPSPPGDSAENYATSRGHHDVAGWHPHPPLVDALHHLELLTPERARALLRAGADIHAAAEPGGPTPLSLAQDLSEAGNAKEGTAAFLVLEAAKLWSHKTHMVFPAPARARASS